MNLKSKLSSILVAFAITMMAVSTPAPVKAAGHWIKGLTWTVTPHYEYFAFTTDPGFTPYDTWTAIKNGVTVSGETNNIIDYMTKTCNETQCDWVWTSNDPGTDWVECAEYTDVVYHGNDPQNVAPEAKQTIKFSTCAPNRAGGHWIEGSVWTVTPNSEYYAFTTDVGFEPLDTWSIVKDGVVISSETNSQLTDMTKTCTATECFWFASLTGGNADWVECAEYTDVITNGTDPNAAAMKISFSTCPTGRRTVSGFAFDDLNANGLWDVGEPTLGGMWYKITNGSWFTCGHTGDDNTFAATVTPGSYTVIPVAPKGYFHTTPTVVVGVEQDSTGAWVSPVTALGFHRDINAQGETCDQYNPSE